MTGPEHYRKAEAHLTEAQRMGEYPETERTHLAYAQLHATLAAAAATALTAVTHVYPSCAQWAKQWSCITEPTTTGTNR